MRLQQPDAVSRRLRNRAFIYGATFMAGYPNQPGKLAKLLESWRPDAGERRYQLARAAKGSTLAFRERGDLCTHFPALEQVFANPLWALLSATVDDCTWDALADTIRIGDQPLDGAGGKLSSILCDRVDWTCFCLHIVLLHTHRERYKFHRMWLARNFARLFGWVSVQSPLSSICDEIHRQLNQRIDNLCPDYPDLAGWDDWSAIHNNAAIRIGRCRTLGWLSGHDQQLALLTWNLSPAQNLMVSDLFNRQDELARTPGIMPLALRQAWQRMWRRWEDHPISLNGSCFDLPGPQWLSHAA